MARLNQDKYQKYLDALGEAGEEESIMFGSPELRKEYFSSTGILPGDENKYNLGGLAGGSTPHEENVYLYDRYRKKINAPKKDVDYFNKASQAIKEFRLQNRLNASPYLQAISSAMQAYEYARPQEADQPSALEQYYATEGVERGLPRPRIERKTQPKLGLQEGLNY